MSKFIVISVLCAMVLLTGCDSTLEVIEMEIVEFPSNIVYRVGHDSQLDLNGGLVKLIDREGVESLVEMKELLIVHSIDFYTEGVYVVEVQVSPEVISRFPVQVIKIGNGAE